MYSLVVKFKFSHIILFYMLFVVVYLSFDTWFCLLVKDFYFNSVRLHVRPI